jgi:hypothetical protein
MQGEEGAPANESIAGAPNRTQEDEFNQRPRRKEKVVMQELAKLIKSNFTRDATIIIDTSTGSGPPRFKYLPVRAKMDTGCDENFVSFDLLVEAGINEELFEVIEKRKGLNSVELRVSNSLQISKLTLLSATLKI